MSTKILRDAVLICGFVSAGIAGVFYRTEVYEFIGISPQDFVNATNKSQTNIDTQNSAAYGVAKSTHADQHSTTIQKSTNGQFWVDARVNNRPINFLVDTGASLVVLTLEDAKKAGLRPENLTYDLPLNTASGKVFGARTDIASISINGVVAYNVQAAVIPKGLSTSLLGMSYLGELTKMEVTSSDLTLYQ